MKKIKYFLKRISRITLSFSKQEEIVWKDLKRMHEQGDWQAGIFEKDRYIQTSFEIKEAQAATFYYLVHDGKYSCRVKVLQDYNEDLTPEIFILATHFNNLLNQGKVVVNMNNQYVEYIVQKDILIPLLYTGDLYQQLLQHYNTSKDIFMSFERLINEHEAPAIIIADLIKSKENPDNKSSD